MPELPAALPPAERTVGQLVAETIRAYSGNFWRVLPLGIPIAVSSQISLGYDANVQTVVLFAFGPLISLAYVYACHLVHHVRPTPDRVCNGGPDLCAGAVARTRSGASGGGVARAVRARAGGSDDRAARIPSVARPRPQAGHRRLRARARFARHPGDRRRRVGTDPDRAAAVAGRQRAANRPRAVRSRAEPAPLPGRRSPLYRPGRAGRLPPTTPKEHPRCRSSSSCRR